MTSYAYDTESNLTGITDAKSNQTAFTYDAFGRVTQTNFPSSLSENYAYDAGNNLSAGYKYSPHPLTQRTDRKSQTITYLYDALNRLTAKQDPDPTAVDYRFTKSGVDSIGLFRKWSYTNHLQEQRMHEQRQKAYLYSNSVINPKSMCSC